MRYQSKGLHLATAAAGLLLGALASVGPSVAQEHTFRWSHYEPVGSIVDTLTNDITKEIEERSEGRLKFNVFPASQLGDWTEVSDQVARGVVDFATQPVSTSYDPRLQVRVLPYSVMNYEEVEAAYFGEDPYLFNLMSEMMADGGLKALAVVAQGFGGASFRECPEGDLFDLSVDRGLKMRFPPGNQAWEKMIETLGYSPTPVPWGELYLALQTGLVDAQAGGHPYSTYSAFRDVTDCWVQFNTHFQNSFVFANRATWEGLSAEDQALIAEVTQRHALAALDAAKGEDEKYMAEMEAAGITVIVPTDEQLASVAAVVRQEVWPVMENVIGPEIMALMREKAGI